MKNHKMLLESPELDNSELSWLLQFTESAKMKKWCQFQITVIFHENYSILVKTENLAHFSMRFGKIGPNLLNFRKLAISLFWHSQ